MSENLSFQIHLQKYDKHDSYRMMMHYFVYLNKLETNEGLNEFLKKIELEVDEEQQEYVKKKLASVFSAYVDTELVKNCYLQSGYIFSYEEQKESNKLVEKIGCILEKESEYENRIEEVLENAKKKHPITARIIALIITSIVASLIEGSVHETLSNFIEASVMKHEYKNMSGDYNLIIGGEESIDTETDE